MTSNEMKFSFMLKFDKMFEFSTPAYDDRQISYLLTSAQNRVFLDKYYAPNNKNRLGFESDEKRRRDLDQLITDASVVGGTITATVGDADKKHPNGFFYDMPTDFLFAVEEQVKLTGATNFVRVRPVRHDEYTANINNPYKKPYSGLAWRMDYKKASDPTGVTEPSTIKRRVEIITDGTNITDYKVRYLRTPPEIVVDEFTPANQRHCVLDETLHDTIIDEAIKIAKASVVPNEYQIADKEKMDSDD